ncbi:helix-turn-helix transcriptional regulator [Metabacillus sp. GX 13764]|uniref:helix-turn-helix transcriptional regulator n=1 Tax=Metabacillus kandeliae TaxID=2900151 RepID=UPI001E50F70E|nr:helix-turn-helix transcriptional regulator [Metabacillus kandeliae]MCD7034344.1 helix-turn-helix transcriptional regulator [Metabacillus kandeliae]
MGNNLKTLREKRGLSQADLARELSVSRSWVHKLETSKSEPSLRMALRIAAILECKIEDIFFLN